MYMYIGTPILHVHVHHRCAVDEHSKIKHVVRLERSLLLQCIRSYPHLVLYLSVVNLIMHILLVTPDGSFSTAYF